MKKITTLFLLFFCAIGFSQNKSIEAPATSLPDPISTIVNYEKPISAVSFDQFIPIAPRTVIVEGGTTSITNERGIMSITSYSDKTVFEAAYTGAFVSEDFDGGPGTGEIVTCGAVVSSAGGGCFAAGELIDGFNITASATDVVYVGATAIGNTSTLMGANVFTEYTIISFAPDGAYAVGLDLYVTNVENADIRIFDTSDVLLDTFTVSNTPATENFIGFISDDAIGRIELQAESDEGELFANLEFGTDALGGGGGSPCDQAHVITGDGNGGVGSGIDSDYKAAADIAVTAGEDFVLDTIEVSFLTFAPEDAPTTANVVYYDNAAGLPGTIIGSETVVPTILSSAPWTNPVAYRFDTSLALTPFTFAGDSGSDTKYWIEVSMGTGTNQSTVYWLFSTDIPVEGEASAQFNAADGFWTVPDATREVVYKMIGNCNPLSVANNTLEGFSFYPNPTNGRLSLNAINNIDTVSMYNLLGQKVLVTKVGATTTDLDISGLTSGTYIMEVTVAGKTGTFKVLKN